MGEGTNAGQGTDRAGQQRHKGIRQGRDGGQGGNEGEARHEDGPGRLLFVADALSPWAEFLYRRRDELKRRAGKEACMQAHLHAGGSLC